ncbi:cupin domain-containing protein [Pantoea brenneri]|uniref:(R)-mandelonitrile lyase n=1 Tax=Pantoea brenneri TaxID=472694 RepID=UPI003917D9D0
MKKVTLVALALALTASAVSAQETASSIRLSHSGDQPSVKGPADYFTGAVRIDAPFQATAPARTGGATVTFEPSARTAWHTHPLGQTLIVTAGVGRVQEWGGPVREIRPGDIIWIPAGVKHWHGAAAQNSLSHIAIAEALDGKVVDWMEKVSDRQYAAAEKS